MEVSRVFPDYLKGVLMKFQENFQHVPMKFHVLWHSPQLPEQKDVLLLFGDRQKSTYLQNLKIHKKVS